MSLLRDRRIVVVGATGGIGSAVVDELLLQDARVLAAGRNPAVLRQLADRGLPCFSIDLGNPETPFRLAERAGAEFGEVEGLVVATGSLDPIGPTRSVDLRRLERAFREQTVAALALVQAFAGLLDSGRSPSIVLFSGGGATNVFSRYTAYALAKVGIVRLVENLAAEEPGWKVNAVAPGFVDTKIHHATRAAGPDLVGAYHEETERRLASAAPPTVTSRLVSFLLSEESEGITGRLISAVWDEWEGEAGRALLRDDPSFGRLRRIDRQRYFERSDGGGTGTG